MIFALNSIRYLPAFVHYAKSVHICLSDRLNVSGLLAGALYQGNMERAADLRRRPAVG
jgi:hypothetical protein